MEGFFKKAVLRDFGDRLDDRAFMTAAFERHNAAVRAAIPPERLLVYQVGEGWPRLCAFLGVPVPEAPFPRVNTRDEMQRMMAATAASSGGGAVEAMGDMARRHLKTHSKDQQS